MSLVPNASADVETPELAPETPEIPQTPEKDPDGDDNGDVPVVPAVAAAPAFSPNFKVKVYDKEHEIPEMYRGLVKDADTEKQVRELFEKAHGLDGMKPKYQKLKDEYAAVGDRISNYEKRDTAISFLENCVKNKDFDTYFETLGFKEEDLQKWMLNKLQQKDLPPEQQRAYNQARELQRKTYDLEAENRRYKSQIEGSQTETLQRQGQQRSEELDGALARADVQSIAQAYDARVGKPGAFREEVISRGLMAYTLDKKDLPVEEAVKQVITMLGPITAQAPQSTPNAAPKAKPPVLPAVEGTAVSPTNKKITSTADLRKLAEARLQEEDSA